MTSVCGDTIKQMLRHRAKIFMRLDQGMTCYLGNLIIVIINRILNEIKSRSTLFPSNSCAYLICACVSRLQSKRLVKTSLSRIEDNCSRRTHQSGRFDMEKLHFIYDLSCIVYLLFLFALYVRILIKGLYLSLSF